MPLKAFADACFEFEQQIGDGVKVTLIARHPTNENAFAVVTNDSIDRVVDTIERAKVGYRTEV